MSEVSQGATPSETAPKEVDAVLAVALKAAGLYLAWFMWLAVANVGAGAFLAADLDVSYFVELAIAFLMLVANAVAIALSVAAQVYLDNFGSWLRDGKRSDRLIALLTGSPLLQYGIAASTILLLCGCAAWIVVFFNLAFFQPRASVASILG
jgi:hypothetical protein